MPLAIVGLSVLQPLFWAGIGTVIIWVGLFLVLAALYVARGFGTLQLVRLRWAGRPEITRPQWAGSEPSSGFVRRTFGAFANGHYWLYLLHALFINPAVAIFTWTLTVVWVSVSLGGLSYWFWDRFTPDQNDDFVLSRAVFGFLFPGTGSPFDDRTGDNILMFAAGVICVLTLPFITRGLVLLNDSIARGVLGAWRSEALQREVADLSASRGAAVTAEDRSLRRLERDLHDGPQQRLIRLQMDLAAAERRLGENPDAVRELLQEARVQAHDTLEELRALSRGFAPPILEDRGLVAGLESLAARSTVPVDLELHLDAALRLPPEIERSAYFVAAELLTNVARHANASSARLTARLRREADDDTTWLDVWVTDNGTGGASVIAGHGLRGLDERVRGLRGMLDIQSPVGGPTLVGAHILVASSLDPSTLDTSGQLPLS